MSRHLYEEDIMRQHLSKCGSGDTFELDSIQTHLHPTMSLDENMTWRGDPVVTDSDWTIIVVTNELKTATYHVHRSVICFGPRLSRYFAKIMLSQDSAKKGKTKHRRRNIEAMPSTKIELDQKDADYFPILLDYIYTAASFRNASHDTMLTAASTVTGLSSLHLASSDESDIVQGDEMITTENAMSLRFLAKTFEVDSFVGAVNKFIQRDLNVTTGPFYLAKGWEYRDDRIIASAQNLCAENFEQLDVKALLKLPFSLFRVIVKALESFDGDNKELSIFLSDIVCRFFEKNAGELSAHALLELTDSLVMPYMSSEAAIGFTTLVKSLSADDNVGRNWSQLVSLCHRCARTVVREYGWSEFSVRGAVDEYLSNSKQGNEHVSRIDSLLFATSFTAALEQAQDDYHGVTKEQQNLEATLNALNDSLSLMEVTNQRKDEVLTKQDQLIGQAKQQIISLKQQLHELREKAEHERYEQQRETQHMQQIIERGPLSPFHPIPQYIQPIVPPPPPPPPPTGRATKSRVHAVLSDLEAKHPSEGYSASETTNGMTTEEIVRDLISPSHVQSSRAGMKRQTLQTREEMRQKSLL
ncbi:hypothetical protein MPSEU_000493700 [Mayamaea pseudoterrestris]|nr:hypothetical protein MPSEU_000493700 [Mayamaea pseudoterrestris]